MASTNQEEEDLEELFDDIEIPAHIREARMAAVKDYQTYIQKGGYGDCEEVSEERQAMEITAKESKCVMLFMMPDFRRCQIMEEHLKTIAKQHFKTRFIKFNAENGRWLCEKLKVRELPAVLCFIDGVCKDRVIGFEELGNTDTFSTKTLENRLGTSGVIHVEGQAAVASKKLFNFAKRSDGDSDSDSDSE
eukprot:m.114924 g.114924  ORF g.114924 m.114924 type:complete len:191 (-) comp14184_c1_seq1:1358-1930(-)